MRTDSADSVVSSAHEKRVVSLFKEMRSDIEDIDPDLPLEKRRPVYASSRAYKLIAFSPVLNSKRYESFRKKNGIPSVGDLLSKKKYIYIYYGISGEVGFDKLKKVFWKNQHWLFTTKDLYEKVLLFVLKKFYPEIPDPDNYIALLILLREEKDRFRLTVPKISRWALTGRVFINEAGVKRVDLFNAKRGYNYKVIDAPPSYFRGALIRAKGGGAYIGSTRFQLKKLRGGKKA